MAPTVLLVDDSPSIRSILRIYLLPRKVEFLEAEDGQRALHLLSLVPVQLVIADVKMAPMDGLTFLRHVRTSPREAVRELPVILLTGETGEGLREQGFAAGANAFITKPIDPQSLMTCVARCLDARAA